MGLLRDCYRRAIIAWHKPRHWKLRPHTLDARLFRAVVVQDEYRLPRLTKDDVCLDVGAHVGSFALAAIRRGAGRVICCEPEPNNLKLLQSNALPYAQVEVRPVAVWSHAGTLHLHNPVDTRNTGAHQVGATGMAVPAVALDDLLRELGHVRLLKLDCEGAEWPLLHHSREWNRVEELCGEYHLPPLVKPECPASVSVLRERLEAAGFRVEMAAAPGSTLPVGLFFARRGTKK
jgi:FkbM family methyltransferase